MAPREQVKSVMVLMRDFPHEGLSAGSTVLELRGGIEASFARFDKLKAATQYPAARNTDYTVDRLE